MAETSMLFGEMTPAVLNWTNDWVNSTNGGVNSTFVGNSAYPPPSVAVYVFLMVAYFLGVAGNAAALYFLLGYSSPRPPRNPKHSLMLISLAINDLIAVIGMWFQSILQLVPAFRLTKGLCISRVLWRVFGLGSGSIVIVMAVERWLALTRPFFYQKYITVGTIKRSIIGLWLIVLVLVCLPFLGFGLYWRDNKCTRYKQATETIDKAYAYLYLVYGSLLCVCLMVCNVAVVKVLVCTRTATTINGKRAILVRRMSRNKDLSPSSSTSEEIAFARVMGLLCVVFYICWLPQLVSIPVSLLKPKESRSLRNTADFLMLLHFSVDPYFYVLQRWPLFKAWCRKSSKSSSRANSTKTTQELFSL